jgi:hypothetical protein
MSFLNPKKPAPAANMPTVANSSLLEGTSNNLASSGSLITSGSNLLKRKEKTAKRTLIGG